MATSQQVREFRLANQSLVLLAQRNLEDFWSSLNTQGNPFAVKAAVLEFFPKLVTAYGDAAALLGADWYDELRNVPPSAASFRAALAPTPPGEQSAGSARWALGPLFTDEPDPFATLTRLAGSTQRLVLQAGRDTVTRSARLDPVATGVARVPSGPETCRFCIMLASRGAVYATELAAGAEGNTYHDDCDCVPTTIRTRNDYPDDHDLKLYERLYAEGSGVGRDVPSA